jgi:hypothetical protein
MTTSNRYEAGTLVCLDGDRADVYLVLGDDGIQTKIENEAGTAGQKVVERERLTVSEHNKDWRTPPIHKARPADDEHPAFCTVCGTGIKQVPGGNGPTWVHESTGMVVGDGADPENPIVAARDALRDRFVSHIVNDLEEADLSDDDDDEADRLIIELGDGSTAIWTLNDGETDRIEKLLGRMPDTHHL